MKYPIRASIPDLIDIMQKSPSSSFHGIAMLMCDMLLCQESSSDDFMWPLEQLSAIASGGRSTAVPNSQANLSAFFSIGSVPCPSFPTISPRETSRCCRFVPLHSNECARSD
jgi:hypothetical protein